MSYAYEEIEKHLFTPEEILDKAEYWLDCDWCGPGIYFLFLGEEIVYVGKSVEIHNRLKTHIENKRFSYCTAINTPRNLIHVLEIIYIALLSPIFNQTRPHLPTPIEKYSCPAYFWKEGRAGTKGYFGNRLFVGDTPICMPWTIQPSQALEKLNSIMIGNHF